MQEQQQRIGTVALEDVDPMAAIQVGLALRLPLPCALGQVHLVPVTRAAPAAMLLMPCTFPHGPRAAGSNPATHPIYLRRTDWWG